MTRAFEAFVRRKTEEALAARLPGFATDFDRASAAAIDIGNAWTERLFDGPFHLSPLPATGRPACSLVFVQSRDGNTGATRPSDLGGGATDAHLIYEGLSRVAADGVLGGAGTIRGGQMVFSVWHPELVGLRASLGKPRHPAQVVATLRGLDIEGSLLFNVPEIPIVVITVGGCADLMRKALETRPWIATIVMDGRDDLAGALEQVRARGIERVSCVGGRGLAAQLLDAQLVQDVYLTTSPKDGGEPGTPIYPKPLGMEVVVRKHGRAEESGVVFEHFSRSHGGT